VHVPQGASVGHWYSPLSGPAWDRGKVTESFFAGLPAVARVPEALPGAVPLSGWLHATDWLALGLVGALLVALATFLVRKPVWMAAGTRRRLPSVFVLLLLIVLIPVALRSSFGTGWLGRLVVGDAGLLAMRLVGVIFMGWQVALLPLTEGFLWAAAWRLMVSGRWSAPLALAAAARRFWAFYAFLILNWALPVLATCSPRMPMWAMGAAYVLRPLVPAALLFVPWSLMRRPRGLRHAIREDFTLLHKHWRALGWFALRFTALMLLAMEIGTSLVAGIHPGVVSGLLGLAPTLLLWAGNLTVALVYASLTGVRLTPTAASPPAPLPCPSALPLPW
jgi:hypothetical protein